MDRFNFDFTLIAQFISVLLLGLIIFFFGKISLFISGKRKGSKEVSEKLDRIIELLENNKKGKEK
jgi:hypothetical protein